MDIDLSVRFAEMELENPLVVSPAGITGTVERVRKAEHAGCGAAVMKTLFEDEVTRSSPTPRFRVITRREGSPPSFVLYSFEQASPFGPERYCEELRAAKDRTNIPVIASIGCMRDESWKGYAAMVERAGADAVELNVSCPHGRALLQGADMAEEMCRVTQLVSEEVSIPVIPKMTPQLSSPTDAALRLERSGADGVVMFNRFTGLDIDLENRRPIMHGSFAGHGGPWSLYYVLRWIIATSPRLSIPIAASGGIWSGEDVAKAICCGAAVTQVCSSIVVNGYGRISSILGQLEEVLDRMGAHSISEISGCACGKVLSIDQVDRRRRFSARVDPSKCTGCRICERVCIYDAVSLGPDGTAQIGDSCDGCGLCAELCPSEAISLQPL